MGIYLIGYEGREARPYDLLQDAIASRDGAHILDNLWIMEADDDATALRDWVHGLMGEEDAIFVVQIRNGNHWASRHLKSHVNAWLKSRI